MESLSYLYLSAFVKKCMLWNTVDFVWTKWRTCTWGGTLLIHMWPGSCGSQTFVANLGSQYSKQNNLDIIPGDDESVSLHKPVSINHYSTSWKQFLRDKSKELLCSLIVRPSEVRVNVKAVVKILQDVTDRWQILLFISLFRFCRSEE